MRGSCLVHTLIDANFRALFVGHGPSLGKKLYGKFANKALQGLYIKISKECLSP